MKQLIDFYLNQLQNMTKDEADLILQVINLSDEQKMAFKIAKQIFEESDN